MLGGEVSWVLTVKVGSSMPVEVAEAEDSAAEASLATLETEELASLRTDWASALTDPASRAAAERAAAAWKRIAATEENRSDRSN